MSAGVRQAARALHGAVQDAHGLHGAHQAATEHGGRARGPAAPRPAPRALQRYDTRHTPYTLVTYSQCLMLLDAARRNTLQRIIVSLVLLF